MSQKSNINLKKMGVTVLAISLKIQVQNACAKILENRLQKKSPDGVIVDFITQNFKNKKNKQQEKKRGLIMNRVGEFEKVSFEEFSKAFTDVPDNKIRELYDDIKLPSRGTSGSAGYDFASTIAFELAPGESMKIPTGIRVKIDDGWWLGCLPRSGMGFKYRLQLDNTMGVIDSDYYYSNNEGHIFAKITNDGKGDRAVSIARGDRFMQGVFIPYGITYSDNANNARNGGFGSTGS